MLLHRRLAHARIAAFGVLIVAGSAVAQPITHAYGVDWVTIGHAGNRDTIESEMSTIPGFREPNGAVDYEYRIMRTEVTAAMQAEFVNAYLQFQPPGFNPDVTLTGRVIGFDTSLDAWRPFGGFEQRPAEINWCNAARMANWYHNGKAMEASAFENGVYDTSTFGFNMQVGFTDQREHSLGAKVWLPTEDEWVKGMFYDPDRYGTGEEGYWTYAHGKKTPPITALPEDGGETDAELNLTFPLDVDAYESFSPLVCSEATPAGEKCLRQTG